MIAFTAPFATQGVNDWRQGRVCITTPETWREAVRVLLMNCEAKYKATVGMKLFEPFRLRSTGWKSQNHHLHGHIRQLCETTGYTMGELKQIVKEETPSWPVTFPEFRGKRRTVYASEADVSIEVESEAIEITHRIAFDLGVRLIEEESI